MLARVNLLGGSRSGRSDYRHIACVAGGISGASAF